MKTYIVLVLCLVHITFAFAQKSIKGRVMGIEPSGDTASLPNAVIKVGTPPQVYIANTDGYFSIPVNGESQINLVVSYTGYTSKPISIEASHPQVQIVLKPAENALAEVTVSYFEVGTYRLDDRIDNAQNISASGLQKLACCNLSESFENNAAIDAGFSDAVSGARQIQMLGLSGIYSQLLGENVPAIRGLSNSYGLSYIPGTWMESIQISKGTSSVLNGYESITGQINVEYKKPQTSDPLLINMYQSSEGRTEANVVSAWKKDERNGAIVLANVASQWMENDNNHDGFLDMPLSHQYAFMTRFNIGQAQKFETRTAIRYLEDVRDGGQMSMPENAGQNLYKISIHSKNLQAFNKLGIPFSGKPYQSLGFTNAFSYHENNSVYGLRNYSGKEANYTSNVVFQTIIGNTNHQISTGASFVYTNTDESFVDTAFHRREFVPGVYAQYTWNITSNLILMSGIRADYNSYYGFLPTPRLHLKYAITPKTSLRASIGRGFRAPNALSDNIGLLASSRKFIWTDDLGIEKAWNTGFNISHEIKTETNTYNLAFDVYHTEFENQLIADFVTNPNQLTFSNLHGRSFSTSMQAEAKAQLFKRLDLTVAYRHNNVKQTYNGSLLNKPYAVANRGLITGSYATRYKKWQFDLTLQLNGKASLPSTASNPVQYQRAAESPAYAYMLGQITRRFKHFEAYVGSENITNYRQKNPIVASDAPFGEHFDASMIWGPVSGRMFYGGFRFTIK